MWLPVVLPPLNEGSMNNKLGVLRSSSVSEAKNLHLRIIQTLNNPKLIFHLKNIEQKFSISFLRRMRLSGGVAFYFYSSVWIIHSKSRGARRCHCLKWLGKGMGVLWQTGELTFWRGRHTAIRVTVARFSTCQKKQELNFWSYQLIFKCWQIIKNILNALWAK